ncbi:MAG TPA: large conductance mechanosensitive channel protein MscL, partial [Janibacter terrae]|nr:large conductance mechanosensitive channel protein MscL [Janibacter terrae]
MSGFKDFLMRGNLVEIAVGLIMATSFGAVVATFTELLLAAIAKVIGANPDFSAYKPGGLPVGVFITAVIAFLILAFVVYFFVVKPYTHMRQR